MAFYRFTRACRQVIVNFLRERFPDPGRHWDGSDWIDLPSIRVVDARSYDPRFLPCIVTDSAAGDVRSLAFNNTIAPWIDEEGTYGEVDETYQIFGGRGEFDIAITVAANDREIQQKLTDAVAFELVMGREWIYYNRHVLLGDVRISDDGVDEKNAQEPIYYCNMRTGAQADWRLLVERETITRMNFDTELVTPDDPFDDMGEIMAQQKADVHTVQESMQQGGYTPLERKPIPKEVVQTALKRTPIK